MTVFLEVKSTFCNKTVISFKEFLKCPAKVAEYLARNYRPLALQG